jgi:hypothetical protein
VASELITGVGEKSIEDITQLPVVSCIHRTACGVMCPVSYNVQPPLNNLEEVYIGTSE